MPPQDDTLRDTVTDLRVKVEGIAVRFDAHEKRDEERHADVMGGIGDIKRDIADLRKRIDMHSSELLSVPRQHGRLLSMFSFDTARTFGVILGAMLASVLASWGLIEMRAAPVTHIKPNPTVHVGPDLPTPDPQE